MEEVRWWQGVWTPVWRLLFDGCRLDRETVKMVREVGGWELERCWGKKGEEKESLFGHAVGVFVKE